MPQSGKKWMLFAALWLLCGVMAHGPALAAEIAVKPLGGTTQGGLTQTGPAKSGPAQGGLPQSTSPQEPRAVDVDPAFFTLQDGAEGQSRLLLSVLLTPRAPGGYFYANTAKGVGLPLKLSLVAHGGPLGAPLPARVLYPEGELKQDPFSGGTVPAHGKAARFYLEVPPAAVASAGGRAELAVSLLLCTAANCTPVNMRVPLHIPAPAVPGVPAANAQPWWPEYQRLSAKSPPAATGPLSVAPSFATADPAASAGAAGSMAPEDIRPIFFAPALEVTSLNKALLLGIFAGLLLNLMPCVLPVLGIKLSSLLQGHEGGEPSYRRFRRHQLFFAAGIMAWFTVMAGIFSGLGLAWGQIFQSTEVVLALALLLFLLALNLFGVLSLPLLDFRAGNTKNPDVQAFFGGLTATLLATPCSGPLLGGVLGWALMQPVGVLTITLESVGLGMALPYLVLGWRPSLAARLPRPGQWMRVMEQVLGFLLLATVVYLLTLLPLPLLPRVLMALVLTGIAAWLWGQIGGPAAGAELRLAVRLIAAALVVFACIWPLRAGPAGFVWQSYAEEDFRDDFGVKPMLVEFTADWCPTCKVMEATTLSSDRMTGWQARYNLTAVRVDLTRDNPAGQALLRRIGGSSIPVLAIFPAGPGAKTPLVLRDIVTPGQLREALEQALGEGK